MIIDDLEIFVTNYRELQTLLKEETEQSSMYVIELEMESLIENLNSYIKNMTFI